jgi:succinoglycan biosynthesis transport protein ExoP
MSNQAASTGGAAGPRSRGARPGGKSGSTIDPVRVIRQHVLGIIVSGVVGAAVGIGAYFALRSTYPLYTSEVMFEVRPGLLESTDIGTKESMSEKDVSRIANTQALLLKHRDVLSDAVRAQAVRNSGWMQDWFVDPVSGSPLDAQAVDDLIKTISTPVIRNTNLFTVRWSWHNSQDVPVVLNAIARAYLLKIERLDTEQFSANEKLFQEQLRNTRLALGDIQDEIQSFILAKGITTLEDPRHSQAMFETQKLTETLTRSQSELRMIQTQYLQTAAKLEGTVKASHDDILEAEYDITLQRQLQTLEMLKSQERSIRDKFNANTSQVRSIEREVRSTGLQIDSKRREILQRNLNARLKGLGDSQSQLQDVIENIEVELEAKDASLRDLATSATQYDAMKAQRTLLETRRDDNSQLLNSIQLMKLRQDAGRVRLVNLALTPRELSFPLPEVIIPAGIVICMGMFIGFLFLREIMNKRIRGASDLAVMPGATILGSIPEIDEDPTSIEDAERAVSLHPDSVVAESYRQAWTKIHRAMQRQGASSLLLASGMPGSGTTTAVTNFADAAAGAGISVIVVDANFRRPALASEYDLDDESPGLGDVLNEQSDAGDVVQSTGNPLIRVVSAGRPTNRLYRRFNDRSFAGFLASLRGTCDLILVDTAPAIAAGDAYVLANHTDAVALVVQANREERGLVARLINQFNDAQGELVGILLNRPRRTAGGYFKKNYELMASYTADADD